MAFGGRLRELAKKYGRVAIGVHLSVSGASIAGLYVAIKNNVDVESVLSKVGISSGKEPHAASGGDSDGDIGVVVFRDGGELAGPPPAERNKTADLVKGGTGALALALLLNKALFPVRVPITIALTPPIARFLARRRIVKSPV
ncbi:hypothetical protein QJS10_CPA01g00362 [Acorus calamus]|uniref:DUF1279 domain-containing protein n=1 Tax=Acorus calamus TaxID=4465 RepID=A0AAV9FK61_ACOCL|nr:hypothetical protein QJS10_CPA01g00362 [Acorus calamus]